MPIRDYPFTKITPDFSRPMLWIRIGNPHANTSPILAKALIDTGADECVFPASVASLLGHRLADGLFRKRISTVGGATEAFAHTSRVEILSTRPDGLPASKVLYALEDTPIDFAKNCSVFLLGVRNFLSNFILKIDYPHEVFSLRQVHQRSWSK